MRRIDDFHKFTHVKRKRLSATISCQNSGDACGLTPDLTSVCGLKPINTLQNMHVLNPAWAQARNRVANQHERTAMQYWRDLKVRSKILLAFGILLSSLLGVGALSLMEMARTNSIVEAISGEWLPTAVHTANLRNAVQRFRIQESKVLIAKLAHGDGLAAAEQSHGRGGGRHRRYLCRLQTLGHCWHGRRGFCGLL